MCMRGFLRSFRMPISAPRRTGCGRGPLYRFVKLCSAWAAFAASGLLLAANWPQAAGPDGTWRVRGANAPVEWSASLNHNILWRTPLPNGGQSGIAVWGDRLFLTTFDEYRDGDPKFSAV